MEFKVGDKIKFLNEQGGGVISEFLNKKIVKIITDDGFEIPYFVSKLVLNEPIPPKIESPKIDLPKNNFSTAIFEKDKKIIPKKSKPRIGKSGVGNWEIDLHIEELVDSSKGMTNAQIIVIQLSHVQKKLNEAMCSNIRKIIFIHGVGTGRLKQEILQILSAYDGITFYDAPYKHYGYGATEVIIHQHA
ncbi:MAG: Smr/MutS family protein [Bacteroidia bacterium]